LRSVPHTRAAIASFERSPSNFIHILRLIGPSVINEVTVPSFSRRHTSSSSRSARGVYLTPTAECLGVWKVDLDSVSLGGSIPTDGKFEIPTCAD
jgi:hypothetical protein